MVILTWKCKILDPNIAKLQERPGGGFALCSPDQGSALDRAGNLGGPQTPAEFRPL